MSLFVGLRGTAEELDIKAQNIWAFTGFVPCLSLLDKLHVIREGSLFVTRGAGEFSQLKKIT